MEFHLDQKRKYNQGIKVYNWLIKTKSRGYIDKSFYGLGFSEYMQGNYRDAIGYFRSLKESDKLYYQQLGSYWTAKCFLKLNDRDLAFKEFNELADIHKIGYYPYLASKEINKKIINQVDAELLQYEKVKLEEQLKFGDYNVILFLSLIHI